MHPSSLAVPLLAYGARFRVVGPSGVGGLTDSILTPAYATSIGLLQWGASMLDDGEPMRYESAPAAGVLGRLRSAVKSMLP